MSFPLLDPQTTAGKITALVVFMLVMGVVIPILRIDDCERDRRVVRNAAAAQARADADAVVVAAERARVARIDEGVAAARTEIAAVDARLPKGTSTASLLADITRTERALDALADQPPAAALESCRIMREWLDDVRKRVRENGDVAVRDRLAGAERRVTTCLDALAPAR